MHVGPSASVVLQSHVKRLEYQWWREKNIFSAYFYVFIVSNEVARKDNNAIDLKKSLCIHPSIFF